MSSSAKPRRRATVASTASGSCNHAPSITLDLLLLLLILSSCAFLIFSSFSHILHSLFILLPPLLPSPSPLLLLSLLLLLLSLLLLLLLLSLDGSGRRRRRGRCQNPSCKGLRDAVEFDVKVQTEEEARGAVNEEWREIGELPWKGGGQGDNPDYECVRKELRRMAPANGRAVLLFRARCGCPLAKLEGWGPKRGKRHKK